MHESEGLLSNAGVFESRDAADVMSTEPERETTRRTDVPAEPDGTRGSIGTVGISDKACV